MTTHHEIILDRDGDPTALIECQWEFCTGVEGSLGILAGWVLTHISARDRDSGAVIELDESEVEYVKRICNPKEDIYNGPDAET